MPSKPQTVKNRTESCPCGTGRLYVDCCKPYLNGDTLPTTAEQLMRSRYTAYAKHYEAYLLQTWHPSTRPSALSLNATIAPQWQELQILRCEAGSVSDTQGIVEFIARYKLNGKAERLHETSRFIRDGQRWFYLQAVVT